jgi:hypothetical protein
MVPLSERDAVMCRAKSDAEMRAICAFIFGEAFDYAAESAFPHAGLLCAVAGKDVDAFRTQVAEFSKRRTSESSGWYENDSLVFLLLVGCIRFEIKMDFLDAILTARERNTNAQPKRVNEVFRALSRGDFGMESPFSFIKLSLLQLADKLALTNDAAQRVHHELTQAGMFISLSPFLQILALRAYDLILFARRPQPYENFEKLIQAVEIFKDGASVGQAFKLLWALPFKWWLGAFSLAVVVIAFFFGFGQRASERNREAARERPTALQIVTHADAASHPLTAVRAVARQALSGRPAGESITAVALETSRLRAPAPKFSVEASAALATITEAQAWLVHSTDGGATQTFLPLQLYPQGVRAFLGGAEPEDYLVLVLVFRTPRPLSPDALAAAVTLRVLD